MKFPPIDNLALGALFSRIIDAFFKCPLKEKVTILLTVAIIWSRKIVFDLLSPFFTPDFLDYFLNANWGLKFGFIFFFIALVLFFYLALIQSLEALFILSNYSLSDKYN